jgi:hypothetical protein
MATVVITAQVEDQETWEAAFRTHADLFRSQTCREPVQIALGENNTVAIIQQPEDLNTFMALLDSPATHEAMAHDGVRRETVQVFVIDRAMEL